LVLRSMMMRSSARSSALVVGRALMPRALRLESRVCRCMATTLPSSPPPSPTTDAVSGAETRMAVTPPDATPLLSPPPPLPSVDDGVVGPFQTALESFQWLLLWVHDTTGLPWWASICLTTIGIRSAMLPVVWYQLNASAKLGKAVPELNYLYQLLRPELRKMPESDYSGRMAKFGLFIKGARASLRKHQNGLKAFPITTTLGSTAVAPLTQIPIFITFVFATRGLIGEGGHGLAEEGALWFSDLTARDETLVLPLLAVASTYVNLELGLGGRARRAGGGGVDVSAIGGGGNGGAGAGAGSEPGGGPGGGLVASAPMSPADGASLTTLGSGTSRFSLVVKDWLQNLLIVGAPAAAMLPQGVLCYWLTSSAFSLAQGAMISNSRARTPAGAPSSPPTKVARAPPHAPGGPAAEEEGGRVVESPTSRTFK